MTSRLVELTLSVVSHKQLDLVINLLDDLEQHSKKGIKVILTLNLNETRVSSFSKYSFPIQVISNSKPKGFGANHNQAFNFCDTPYFCVINPDIRLPINPFNVLISELEKHSAALIAPMVINPDNIIEDSVRKFPTPFSILKKIVFRTKKPDYPTDNIIINPDWIGGMFMLFKSEKFKSIGGFDEQYYLYYEDVDISKSLHKANNNIVYSPNTSVIHAARRTSHKNLSYLILHIKSMLIFFLKK